MEKNSTGQQNKDTAFASQKRPVGLLGMSFALKF